MPKAENVSRIGCIIFNRPLVYTGEMGGRITMNSKRFLLSAAFLLIFSGAAFAQIDPPTFTPRLPAFVPLNANELYSVSITCAPRSGDINPVSEGLFASTKYTTTHAVFISTKTASQLADNTATLPSGALGMALVYVTDGDKGTEIDNRSACDQTFLVKQSDTLFLIPAVNFTKTVKTGPFFTALDSILKIVTPLTSVFLGIPIPADIINKVSAIGQTEDPFGKLLALFNRNRSYARSYKLSVGTSRIDTQFSSVTVTVKSVPSIVDVPKYLDELKKQIDAAPEKIQTTDIGPSCLKIVSALARMGFVSEKDQVYALTYTALKSFTDKDSILQCLGKRRAGQAVALGDLLWRGIPAEFKITQQDVDNMPPEPVDLPNQPSFTSIRGKMDTLMVLLGRYVKNTPPLKDAVEQLPKIVASNVVVDNKTASVPPPLPNDVPSGFPAFLDAMKTTGFYHFGCFAPNSDSSGKFANNTNVVFLAFNAPATENKTTIQKTIALFPYFANGLIATVVASDNLDWIRYVLAHRDQAFDCNGFQVEDK
jgi:hypothetical protein